MRFRSILLALAFVASGCTKKAVEIEVRDPGRVQVALRVGSGAAPVLLPDGRSARVTLPVASGQSRPVVSRDERTIAFEWAESGRRVQLVDAERMLPALRTADGIRLTGPLLYADYDLTERRASEPGSAGSDSIPVQLSTPLDNVARAEHVTGRRKWPAYVMLPLGGLLTLAGVIVVTTSHDDLGRLAGGFYIAGGVPLAGYGVYILVDEPTVVSIVPRR